MARRLSRFRGVSRSIRRDRFANGDVVLSDVGVAPAQRP